MWSECSGPGWHHARYLDSCQVSPLRREAAISAQRDIQGQAVAPAWTETCKVSGVSLMGELKRGEAWEEQRRVQDRYASTLVIAAAIIAAVRLAREQDISRPSPRLRVWLAP